MSSNGIFLTAEWRHLAILNYEVDSALLSRFVPAGTELDHWNGKSFVSLVGFRFLKTAVWGIPIPFHRNFDEVNLRFYVRRRETSEIRRGVVFIKEIVPRWAIASLARRVYGENYDALPMSHRIEDRGESGVSVGYGWRSHLGWSRLSMSTEGSPVLPGPGSQEQFITEHYWGYTSQKTDGTMEYRVEHPPWRVWKASSVTLEGDMTEFYGGELAKVLLGPPSSAFLAEGSSVTLFQGRKI